MGSPTRQRSQPHSRRGAKTAVEIPTPIAHTSYTLGVNRISLCLDTQGLLEFLKPSFKSPRQSLGLGIVMVSEDTLGSLQGILRLT